MFVNITGMSYRSVNIFVSDIVTTLPLVTEVACVPVTQPL